MLIVFRRKEAINMVFQIAQTTKINIIIKELNGEVGSNELLVTLISKN